jgi:hypothetical protein
VREGLKGAQGREVVDEQERRGEGWGGGLMTGKEDDDLCKQGRRRQRASKRTG